MDNETTEQVMNDHTGLRLADAGQYDLFAGLDRTMEATDDGPIAARGGIQFQRPTRDQMIGAAVQRIDKRIEDEQQVRVQLTVGDGGTDIGTFNIAHGSAGLAELLRQVADRLDP